MIVSTHSSHVAHEIDFGCLRYFRKKPVENKNEVPCATIVNLSKTFGQPNNSPKEKEVETDKFAERYLKTTHCDLFFADGAILVEGPAERMLVPHFIRHKYPELDARYITVLEIGGSHAHRLRPLIEDLGIVTLVVTDIDSIQETSSGKIQPERNKPYRTGNTTLKSWLPQKENLDGLLDLADREKVSENGLVRVAFQYPFEICFNAKTQEAIPYTFEDALVFSNVQLFKGLNTATGLIKKMSTAISKPHLTEAAAEMFNALENGNKAEMALELLYFEDPSNLKPPKYIAEGLEWLQEKLKQKDNDYLNSENNTNGDEKCLTQVTPLLV
jgi:hypothetical protein